MNSSLCADAPKTEYSMYVKELRYVGKLVYTRRRSSVFPSCSNIVTRQEREDFNDKSINIFITATHNARIK